MSAITRFFSTTFSWLKSVAGLDNKTKQDPRRPKEVDWTDSLVCNSALTKGLYHNSYPGMKLAGSMCYTPIAVPVWLMGIPIPIIDDREDVQEMLDATVKMYSTSFQQFHTQIHRDGTFWIWPHYSSKDGTVIWEVIEDDSITDIIRDLTTRKIIKIITDEQITVSTGYNQTAIINRRREFTKEKIVVMWSGMTGSVPVELKDRTQRNPAGILPIPFANNKDCDEVRGHSDYERILSDLKDYHDIDLKRSKMLAKFDAKMIQEVMNVDDWKKNNGWSSLSDVDIASTDLIINLTGQEKTTFAFPDRAHEAYESALQNKFRKIVEGSGIPEILWGTKVEGNKASADQQMDLVVKLVQDKRRQTNESYRLLFDSTVRLLMLSTGSRRFQEELDIKIEWSNLDAISEETKSIIFRNFAQGISQLINSAGVTKEQIYKLWIAMYPDITPPNEFDTYDQALSQMAKHKQYQNMPYELGLDMEGIEPVDESRV